MESKYLSLHNHLINRESGVKNRIRTTKTEHYTQYRFQSNFTQYCDKHCRGFRLLEFNVEMEKRKLPMRYKGQGIFKSYIADEDEFFMFNGNPMDAYKHFRKMKNRR